MVNLLGDLWSAAGRAPDWTPILADPDAKLHLYGKKGAKPARKMGHFCVLGDAQRPVDEVLARARAIQQRLRAEER